VSKATEREAIIAHLIGSIQKERLRQKLSLNEVASRAGLSHTMIMRVEKRERLPTIDTLLRIAGALEITLSGPLAQAEKAARKR
jgi:transcriptional regulator with XRE-family HTH domain